MGIFDMGTRFHTVMPGETLASISLFYYNTRNHWREIYEHNRDLVADPNHIAPPMRLVIPHLMPTIPAHMVGYTS